MPVDESSSALVPADADVLGQPREDPRVRERDQRPESAYHDVEAAGALGHADVVAPPTFAIVLSLPAGAQFIADPEAGVDYSRVVHGEQRFVHTRPIVAGDELQVTLTVENIASLRAMN